MVISEKREIEYTEEILSAKKRISEIETELKDKDMTVRHMDELHEELSSLSDKVSEFETEARLPEALGNVSARCFLSKESSDGKLRQFYTLEMYADYRDTISEKAAANMVNADDPVQSFKETVGEWWEDSICNEYRDIEERVRDELADTFDIDESYLDSPEGGDMIRDYVREVVTIDAPHDHYLDQEIDATIIMDCGESNWDYTLNAVYDCGDRPDMDDPSFNVDEWISDKSGIAWLAATQGYTRDDMAKVLFADEPLTPEERKTLYTLNAKPLGFLKSLYVEEINYSHCMSAVTFLVKMSIRQYLAVLTLLKAEKGSITVDKSTVVGLFDPWSGGGSLLEIELEKDVTIPLKLVRSITPDTDDVAGVRYCVGGVYGLCSSAWRDTIREIAAPKAPVNELASLVSIKAEGQSETFNAV